MISNKHHLGANLLLQEFTILFLLQNGINNDGVLSGDCWAEFLQQKSKLGEQQNINSSNCNICVSTPQSHTPLIKQAALKHAQLQLKCNWLPHNWRISCPKITVWSSTADWIQIIKLVRYPQPNISVFLK